MVGRLAARHGIKVRLRRSWFGGVAALVLLPTSLLGGPETELQPAAPRAPGQPVVEPSGNGPAGDGPTGAEPVPTPVPRAFAVRSPEAGRDNGAAG